MDCIHIIDESNDQSNEIYIPIRDVRGIRLMQNHINDQWMVGLHVLGGWVDIYSCETKEEAAKFFDATRSKLDLTEFMSARPL